ncbi:hypothetical protein [Nocardia stercoris]|uniref:hypothetical protein n=1 Tax=Nocardia stercoris TaxID=2483361 RepID=UPI0018F2DD00|nr:hypothetical protein [Nocardia stercoris]
MGTSLYNILTNVMYAFRYIGLAILTIASMAILISEAAKSKLSPGKVLAVAGSAIVAAVVFWILPTIVSDATSDSGQVVGSTSGCAYQAVCR